MDSGAVLAIVGGVAAAVYIVETTVKYGYPLLKRKSEQKAIQNLTIRQLKAASYALIIILVGMLFLADSPKMVPDDITSERLLNSEPQALITPRTKTNRIVRLPSGQRASKKIVSPSISNKLDNDRRIVAEESDPETDAFPSTKAKGLSPCVVDNSSCRRSSRLTRDMFPMPADL